jgi:outer membrane protein TolC
MKRVTRRLAHAAVVLLLGLGTTPPAGRAAEIVLYAAPTTPPAAPAHPGPVTRVVVEPAPAPRPAARPPLPPRPDHPLFGDAPELSAQTVVEQVLARNPSLAQTEAAWQAAQARYPQVTSLDDPMFAATVGPGTVAPDDPGIHFAYRLEISQKYPWPGKLHLRGENALAEARAAGNEVEDTRLRLVESARTAFSDYYLVGRALEVNAANLRLLERFRNNAQTRYENNLVPLQDVLQAKVEIGRERQRRLTLERMQQVAVARLNTLLDLPPDAPLSPPPRGLPVRRGLPPAEALRAAAVARRPDLRALAERLAAEQALLALAHKEFYPDLEPFFMYDRFMGNNEQNKDLAAMLGVRLNLPVRKAKRGAAVAEAEARVNQRRAELADRTNRVSFEVQEAYAEVVESERSVRVYEQTILPAARQNVEAAASAYEAAKIPFLSLIEAQRNRVLLLDRYYEAVADYFRRLATLERVVGGPLDPSSPVAPCRPTGTEPGLR